VLSGSDTRPTWIGRNVVVGANATVCSGVRLGDGCRVEPGSVVRADVPPGCVVSGNPAIVVGYVSVTAGSTLGPGAQSWQGDEVLLRNGAALVQLQRVSDPRGSLCVADFAQERVPFVPARMFVVFDVPTREVRGQHAHLACHQFLVAVSGRLVAIVDDGHQRKEISLDEPLMGLYMPPLTWGVQYRYSSDARLLVMASHVYDPDDYIRDYESFLEIVDKSA